MQNDPWWPIRPAFNQCPMMTMLWMRALRGGADELLVRQATVLLRGDYVRPKARA